MKYVIKYTDKIKPDLYFTKHTDYAMIDSYGWTSDVAKAHTFSGENDAYAQLGRHLIRYPTNSPASFSVVEHAINKRRATDRDPKAKRGRRWTVRDRRETRQPKKYPNGDRRKLVGRRSADVLSARDPYGTTYNSDRRKTW